MTKHQAPKDFERPPQPPCRAAELGLRFAAALDQWSALDGNLSSTKTIEMTNELEMEALNDVAVFAGATSALGALHQLCIVSSIADRLSDMAFDAKAYERAARADMVRVDNALWSIRRFIEGHFNVSAAAVGGEYLMPEHASHAAQIQKALAVVKVAEEDVPQFQHSAA